jgi:hypothetical protein
VNAADLAKCKALGADGQTLVLTSPQRRISFDVASSYVVARIDVAYGPDDYREVVCCRERDVLAHDIDSFFLCGMHVGTALIKFTSVDEYDSARAWLEGAIAYLQRRLREAKEAS